MKTAYISEIYNTLQGEGPYTGERQIFVRFAGCPLRCNYCDTPGSLMPNGHPRLSVADVLKEIRALYEKTGIKTVSFTGGEPLVNSGFLKELLPELKEKDFRIYIETAGVHPESLAEIARFCDVVSMDIKLPSATGRAYWDEHKRFLDAGGEKVFAKIVLEKRSKKEELKTAVGLLSERPHPPLLVLQPATAQAPDIEPLSQEGIGEFYALAKAALPEVLVMPQQHKLWGIR